MKDIGKFYTSTGSFDIRDNVHKNVMLCIYKYCKCENIFEKAFNEYNTYIHEVNLNDIDSVYKAVEQTMIINFGSNQLVINDERYKIIRYKLARSFKWDIDFTCKDYYKEHLACNKKPEIVDQEIKINVIDKLLRKCCSCSFDRTYSSPKIYLSGCDLLNIMEEMYKNESCKNPEEKERNCSYKIGSKTVEEFSKTGTYVNQSEARNYYIQIVKHNYEMQQIKVIFEEFTNFLRTTGPLSMFVDKDLIAKHKNEIIESFLNSGRGKRWEMLYYVCGEYEDVLHKYIMNIEAFKQDLRKCIKDNTSDIVKLCLS